MKNKERISKCVVICLKNNGELTGREIAQILYDDGITYSPFREAVAPRITELRNKGLVVETRKVIDDFTKKRVWKYKYIGD